MRKANLLGFCIPEQYGGLGMDYISLGLASEEMEYGDTSARVILSVHIGLFSLPLLTWGSEAQKQKYLVPAAKGDKITTFGLTEPAAGSDVVGLQSTAVKQGDHYVLNGEKMWISLAGDRRLFLCLCLDRSREKEETGSLGTLLLYRRARFPGGDDRVDPWETWRARGEYRMAGVLGCESPR